MPPKKKKGKKKASIDEPTDENPAPELAEPVAVADVDADQVEEAPRQKKGKKKKGKGKKKGKFQTRSLHEKRCWNYA